MDSPWLLGVHWSAGEYKEELPFNWFRHSLNYIATQMHLDGIHIRLVLPFTLQRQYLRLRVSDTQ